MTFLMKPDPFSSEVNRLFNTLLAPGEGRAQRWSPAMDLVEAEDHYVLRADLPGMDEKDVSIEINDNVLTVSGERRDEQEESRQGWHRVERTFGRFSRSLTLPEGIEPEAVTAEFAKGVLSITVPKPEERKPRRVEISVGGSKSEGGAQRTVEGTASERQGSESSEDAGALSGAAA
jgi:HSP20 family protein